MGKDKAKRKRKGVTPTQPESSINNSDSSVNINIESPEDKNSPKKLKPSLTSPRVYTVIGEGISNCMPIVDTPTSRSTSGQNVSHLSIETTSDTAVSSVPNVLCEATSDVLSSASHVLLGNSSQHNPLSYSEFTTPPQRESSMYVQTCNVSDLPADEDEPRWVAKLISRMDAIDMSLQGFGSRITSLETEIGAFRSLHKRVSDIEESVRSLKAYNASLKEELKMVHFDANQLVSAAAENTRIISEAHQRIDELENRSMRDNLLFTGVPEEHHENTD